MRFLVTALLALLVSPELALGQPQGSITSSNVPGSPDTAESCVEVDIAGAKALDCINRKLKEDAARINPLPKLPPIDARSKDIQLGIVNAPAVQQQYGPSFGKSAVPYRPSATYAPRPFGGH